MLKIRVIPCLDVKEGRVVKGMDVVDKIKKGDELDNGKVDSPDFIKTVKNV